MSARSDLDPADELAEMRAAVDWGAVECADLIDKVAPMPKHLREELRKFSTHPTHPEEHA